MYKIDTLFERGIIKEEKTVMLIDVEGAEYEVILWAKNFINKVKPFIIMEYNQIGKKFYKITDVLSILDENYKVFRLNKFGRLDKELDNTYNVVFINETLNFPT
jgi:hypothetical protein